MRTRLLTGIAIGALGLATGCDGSNGADDCQTKAGYICSKDLRGIPFARAASVASDYCSGLGIPCAGVEPPAGATTGTLTNPEPGKLCLTGVLAPSGFAVMSMQLDRWNADMTAVVEAFDATVHHIAQVSFAIDAIPAPGVVLAAHVVKQSECPSAPLDCFFPPNYEYGPLATPGPVAAPLADFAAGTDGARLDGTKLHDIFLQTAGTGDYAFCISDVKFLDAAGGEVRP